MNASLLLQQQQATNMMLTYPQTALLHSRPTVVTTHGVLPQPLTQLPGFPVALAPTLLHAHIPTAATLPTSLLAHSNTSISPRAEVSSPKGSDKSSPPVKSSHSSFSIDSILGKKQEPEKETSSSSLPVAPVAASPIPATRTATTNGLFYFYTPAQPSCSPFPFATTPRPFEQDLQRSPLGSLVIPSPGKNRSTTRV